MPPTNGSNRQETPKSPNFPRFSLLFILIIISLLVAPSFRTDNIFNICVFFATFTTLIYALTDLIIYLSKEPPHPTTLHINSVEKGNKKTTKNFLSTAVKKAVHHIQQCRVAVSRVMRSIFRNKWLIGIFAIALSFPASLTLTEHWKEIAGKITAVLEFFIIENKSLGISILITFIVALIIFHKKIITTFQKFISGLTSKYFIFTLATLAIIGASSALLIPSYTSWFREPGYTSAQQDSAKETLEKVQETPAPTASPTGNKAAEVEQKSTSDLRLHLLYVTGGIIAILGLIETNRKNSQDHIRQVHAARRDRYIEAVDKLSSKQASVRLGGVYALFGLIDEWLDDDNIDEETRLKEGQVIVNNLCSYVRSPFILAEKRETIEAVTSPYVYSGNLNKDKAKLREEQDIRRAIFIEMSKRCSAAKRKKGSVAAVSNTWSKFNFDFTRAPIFYPLNNLAIEQAQFSSAQFYGGANFQDTAFIGNTYFEDAEFTGYANFMGADFTGNTYFEDAEFTGNASFMGTDFTGDAHFWSTKFIGNAHFGGAVFAGDANFLRTEFTRNAHFELTEFTGKANFLETTFTGYANFLEATFTGPTSFKHADFKRYPPIFADVNKFAQFSAQVGQKDYVFFSVKQGSWPIVPGIATLDGKPLIIPLGAVLFDPDSGRISKRAK